MKLDIWNNKASQELINEDKNNWCEKADKNFDSLKRGNVKFEKEFLAIKAYNDILSQ